MTCNSNFSSFAATFSKDSKLEMRKKTKNRRKRASYNVSNLVPCQAVLSVKRKLHDAIEKIQQYLLTLPFIIGLLRIRDHIGEKLRQLILAFFDFLSPCWTFLFIHKSEPQNEKIKRASKKIERVIETIVPNPFVDEPNDNGPTDSKSHGSKKAVVTPLKLWKLNPS